MAASGEAEYVRERARLSEEAARLQREMEDNLRLLSELPWVDIPILLNNGRIAKLTFEKGAAGQRDFAEAVAYWQKQ